MKHIDELILDFCSNLAREGFSGPKVIILDDQDFQKLAAQWNSRSYYSGTLATPLGYSQFLTIRHSNGEIMIEPYNDTYLHLPQAFRELVDLTPKALLLTANSPLLRHCGSIKEGE